MLLTTATEFLAQMPDPGGPLTPPGSENIQMIFRWGLWVGFIVAMGGVVFWGGRLAVSHQRGLGGGDEAGSLWKPLVAFIAMAHATGIPAALVSL